MSKVKKGKYKHFKNKFYEVICVARDCEDSAKEVVVYRALWDSEDFGFGQVWVRDLDDFCGYKVFDDGTKVKRFEFVGDVSRVGVMVKRLREDAVLPRYAHEGDAAMDLCALDGCVVKSGERKLVATGISMELPEGYFASIRGKSGLAYKKGILILGGVIEHGYRGDYGVIVLNTGGEDFVVEAGDKIAQVVIAPVATAEVVEVEELGESVRGEDGFGSTGK